MPTPHQPGWAASYVVGSGDQRPIVHSSFLCVSFRGGSVGCMTHRVKPYCVQSIHSPTPV